ncbi:MAG: metal-sensitive transcriptional regulator [candidate division WOR-3 bacterium]
MKPNIKKECLKRMNYLKGHLDGVRKMIENDAYCIDIIKQNKAVINALHKVNELILSSHLDTCVMSASLGKNKKKQKELTKELIEIYKTSNHI